jgi:hypothetical protein
MAEFEGTLDELGTRPGIGLIEQRPGSNESVPPPGYPLCLQLWRGWRASVVLVPLPDLQWSRWPAIIINERDALPLASDRSTAFPQFLVKRLVSANPKGAARLRDNWAIDRKDAGHLQSMLAGDPTVLEAIVMAISDERRFAALTDRKAAGFERAHSDLIRSLDPSPSFARFADWIDQSIDSGTAADGISRIDWPWNWLALSWSAFDRSNDVQGINSALCDAWNVIERFSGIGSGVANKPTWGQGAGAYSGSDTLALLLDLFENVQRSDDPIKSRIAKSMIAQGFEYDGVAHAEAVAMADEAGDPHRAWGLLHSAAWWMGRNLNEVPPAIFDGARLVCERHNWADIRWVVERNAKVL